MHRRTQVRILALMCVVIFFLSAFFSQRAIAMLQGGAFHVVEKEEMVLSPTNDKAVGVARLSLRSFGTGSFRFAAGKNHREEANAYAVKADQVQRWLQGIDTPPQDRKQVFLTFDDGPSENVTPRILDILKSEQVHGTFFEIAPALEKASPALLHRMIDEGHSIAIHTYSHDYSILYPGRIGNTEAIVGDYQKAYQVFRKVLGPEYKTMACRYPGGHMSWSHLSEADMRLQKELGLYWIDWNASSQDAVAGGASAESILAKAKNTSSPNAHVIVLLMHASAAKGTTADALPGIIKYFKDNGFEFSIIE